MSLHVFSELLQSQEGIKSIYALDFPASIMTDKILRGVCMVFLNFSGSLLCSKTVLPSSSESLAYVFFFSNFPQVILTLLMACTIVI